MERYVLLTIHMPYFLFEIKDKYFGFAVSNEEPLIQSKHHFFDKIQLVFNYMSVGEMPRVQIIFVLKLAH